MRRLVWLGPALAGAGCTLLFDVFAAPSCGDGVRDPGELCYTVEAISAIPRPESVAVGDFNQDGRADLVVTSLSRAAHVFLQEEGGGFAAAVIVPTGSDGTNAVIARDFNQDGAPDFATADAGGDTCSILLNQGDGRSFSLQSLFAGNQPNWIDAADLDGDGDDDLVTANQFFSKAEPDSVSVLSNAEGAFSLSLGLDFGATEEAVALGDLDGDGDVDLVTAVFGDDTLSLIRNDGTGNFSDELRLPAGGAPRAVALADLDQNGQLDIVSANANGTVGILLQQGGAFLGSFLVVGGSLRYVLPVDINGDRVLDLAVASGNGANTVQLFPGDGAGGFGAPSLFVIGANPFWIAALPSAAGAPPDLAVVAADEEQLYLLRADP